jgi:hypothetical protein
MKIGRGNTIDCQIAARFAAVLGEGRPVADDCRCSEDREARSAQQSSSSDTVSSHIPFPHDE